MHEQLNRIKWQNVIRLWRVATEAPSKPSRDSPPSRNVSDGTERGEFLLASEGGECFMVESVAKFLSNQWLS